MTTIMQPPQCDLQPQIQETHRTTHIDTTTRCRTQRRNPLRPERPQPQPPHTGGTFHRRLQPLYTEKHKVSFFCFLPKTKPMQHSCSHYTSSTAQGDGGSFRNRKPIGEIGCCESRMAERIHWWTERSLELCFWSGCNRCSGHLTHNSWM